MVLWLLLELKVVAGVYRCFKFLIWARGEVLRKVLAVLGGRASRRA